MPQIRRIPLGNGVVFEAPFFHELLPGSNEYTGVLSRDFEAHALWHYLGAAMQAYEMAKNNIVYEDDLSRKFDRETARNLFISICNVHQVSPAKTVRFWDMIDSQRRALGAGSEDLPAEYKFRYWGN